MSKQKYTNIQFETDKNSIITKFIPEVVKDVMTKISLPKNEKELIEFCQAMGKVIIERIEPIRMN